MSVLDRFIAPRGPEADKAAISAISKPGNEQIAEVAEVACADGHGVIIDFDREKARKDANRRTEERRKRLEPVLKLMTEDDETRDFCLVTDDQSDPNYVFLSFVIRGKASGEMTILQEEYDGLKLLAVLEKVVGEVRGNK